MNSIEVKANLGLIIRGDIRDLAEFSDDLEKVLDDYEDLILVHDQLSNRKMYFTENEKNAIDASIYEGDGIDAESDDEGEE